LATPTYSPSRSLPKPRPSADLSLREFFASLDACRDKNTLTHGLHPYPAKFIPHIPRELLRMYGHEGAVVWDPMVGSGTTLVEASVAGMPSIGTDINPIATLVARAKTQLLDHEAVQQVDAVREQCEVLAALLESDPSAAPRLVFDCELPDIPNRDHWFHRQTSRELVMVMRSIEALATVEAARDLCCAAMSAVLVAVSYQDSETRWRATVRPWLPAEAVGRFLGRLVSSVAAVEEYADKARARVEVCTIDARDAPLKESSVDLVVTSPPYANSHDYYLYNKLRMFWLGYDVRSVQESEIGSRNRHSDKKESIETYFSSLAGVLARVQHVLRPDGRAILVVGDAVIRGEFFDMSEKIPEVASRVGLELEFATAFEHRRFNSAFRRGFGTKHHKQTRVLVFGH
jgi:DNA modification methylase